MASRLDLPPATGGQGLIAVRRTVYAAPEGSYASMEFLHAEDFLNIAPHHDAVFQLNNSSDDTYHPTDMSTPLPPADRVGSGGSGFTRSSPSLPAAPTRIPTPMMVSRRNARFVGANEAHPDTPFLVVSLSGVNLPAPPCLVPHFPDTEDISMMLGDGKNTNTTSLEDSKHAVPESSLPSCFARLPPTVSSITVDMMDALDDIQQGRSSPLSETTEDLDVSIDCVPTHRFHFQEAETYDDLSGVVSNIQALGLGYNEMLDLVGGLVKHVTALENLTQRLQRRIDVLEDVSDAAKFSSFPPMVTASRADPVVSPPTARAADKKAKYLRSGCLHPQFLDGYCLKGPKHKCSWERLSGGYKSKSVSSAPMAIRDWHITIRFAIRRSVALPTGYSAETIRTHMNAVFANSPRIRGLHLYIKKARMRADLGSIFIMLLEHSADKVGGFLEKCHAILMRDFGLPDFSFAKDTRKMDILVVGMPQADTGHGSIWHLEDWTKDKVYDGLRTDLERLNPGLITVGRSNIIGFIHAMGASDATNCAIKFTVEKLVAADAALRKAMFVASEACSHMARICLLCESSGHYIRFPQCPSLRITPDIIPTPLDGSPIAETSDSIAGVADRSWNQDAANTIDKGKGRVWEISDDEEADFEGNTDGEWGPADNGPFNSKFKPDLMDNYKWPASARIDSLISVLDLFSFDNLLFILDPPGGGKHVVSGAGSWELLSFVENFGVEVYVCS
ncbi:hypothetical protein B9Z19DRAFT_1122168 [Tuber borchii]|uniref:Uncharacterized protein n=1 Tax=Tuber borchii TaxID=42251 RepID=A0A2T7A0Z4_TUBBO|nr:hypothetical protein B9Z19DRAFT_1122168 [Tuber borchii]